VPIEMRANAGSSAEAYELPGTHENVLPFLIVRIRLAKTPTREEIASYNHLVEAVMLLSEVIKGANLLRDREPGRQS